MLVFSILQIYEQYVYIKYMLYQFWHIHVVQFYLIPLNICKTQMMIGEQSEHDQLWLPTMTHFFLDCDKGFSQYTSRFRPSVMVCKLNFIVVKLVKEEDLVDFLRLYYVPCEVFYFLYIDCDNGFRQISSISYGFLVRFNFSKTVDFLRSYYWTHVIALIVVFDYEYFIRKYRQSTLILIRISSKLCMLTNYHMKIFISLCCVCDWTTLKGVISLVHLEFIVYGYVYTVECLTV